MPAKEGRAWKQERATVHRKGASRPDSNKYSGSDKGKKPAAGERSRAWVGGYTRKDGTAVAGHYRNTNKATHSQQRHRLHHSTTA